jgi:DNA-binding transcriptional MocR family regulator
MPRNAERKISTRRPSQTGLKRPRSIVAERLAITLAPTESDFPLFVQIREKIRDLIATGTLVPGMRLPPVRLLAQQLRVSQITVAKAYRELAKSKLIEGRRGGGSFVRAAARGPRQAARGGDHDAAPLLAERLFELARAPGVIAFSANYPVMDKRTIEEFRGCLTSTAEAALENCFSYDPPLGRSALREQIQIYLREDGVVVDADDIMVTSGAQQAIDLAVRTLVRPGDAVIIEQPAYYGAINALRNARAQILEVPLEPDGLNLEIVERYLVDNDARLICTNPTFQNPTGVTMSEEKRRALLTLARRYGAPILEDDHSHELRFSGEPVPAIRALADEDDLIVYARGFGKTLLPGVRLGYLVMPEILKKRLLTAKAHADLHCNNFIQEAVAQFLARQCHRGTIERLRDTYRPRQRKLYQSLVAGMPEGATVSQPSGGLSFWLTLPEGADVSDLYFRAVRRGVAFVAGDVFYASPSHPRSLRISFGYNRAEEIEEGVQRLCSVVKDLLSRRSARSLVMM